MPDNTTKQAGSGDQVSQSGDVQMSLFGKLVKTVVNVATLPVAVAKDVVTLGNVANSHEETFTQQKLQQIKDEADD